MRFRRLLLGLAVALPLALVGCKINTINSFNASPAQIRVASVVPDATIGVSVDGTVDWAGVRFESVTEYQQFTADEHTFGVRVDGTSNEVVTNQFNVAGNQNYTLVPFGTIAFPAILMLPDVVSDTANGQASVRFVLVAAGQINVDIYVTAPAVVIDNINPTISYLGYGSAGGYTSFSAGAYRTRITFAGTKTVIYDSGVYTLLEHSVSNALIYSRGSNSLVNVMLLDTAGGTVFLDNTLSQVKALNASPGMGNVDLLVDNNDRVPGVAFAAVSTYVQIPASSTTFAFQASATPGAIIAQTANSLTAATDGTMLLLGFPGAQTAKLFPDNNLPPPTNYTKVRFINASPDAPTLDVLLNDVKVVSGLATGTASLYYPLPINTYTVKFVDPVTGNVSSTLVGAVFSGGVYTVYAVGPAANMQSIFSVDR
jgi:Domain of unknown function (DUF4397)